MNRNDYDDKMIVFPVAEAEAPDAMMQEAPLEQVPAEPVELPVLASGAP